MRAVSRSSGRAASSPASTTDGSAPARSRASSGVGVPVGARPGDDERGRPAHAPPPSPFSVRIGRRCDQDPDREPVNAATRSSTGIGGHAGEAQDGVGGDGAEAWTAADGGDEARRRRRGGPRRRGGRPTRRTGRSPASAWGSASTVAPRRPEMHSSARATARPPSLTSWHDRTRPARIAGVQPAVAGRRVGIGLRRGAGGRPARRARGRGGCRRTRAPSSPSEHDDVARRRQLGRDAATDVGHVGDGGDHERRRDGVALPVVADVLVVQRVLARHERRAVGDAPRRGSRARRRPARRASSAAAGRPTRSCRAGRPGPGRRRRRRRCGSPRRSPTWAIASGSCSPYHGLTPMPTASPWVSRGSASTTPSPGPSPATPTSGRTTVPPPISWS